MLALASLVVSLGPAFVVETSTVVRAEPNDNAVVVREIPIWTAVRVDAVDGAWAKVTVGPRTLRYDSPGGEAKPIAPIAFDDTWPRGWLRVASVDANPESRLGLVAHAKTNAAERNVLLLRAYTLDPNDPEIAHLVTPAARVSRHDHVFAHADLVVGCRGDLARASVVIGTLHPHVGQQDPLDACAAHLDLRAPCKGDAGEHKAALAKLTPRFGNDGPALRLVPGLGAADRPVFVVTRLLAADGCDDDCEPEAATSDVRVDRLRIPKVDDGRTTLHVLVPRYTGALYDVVAADSKEDVDAEPIHYEVGALFDVDPRDEPGPGVHLYTAPDACCTCDE